ncbi:MAG: hypothetical protein WAL90_04705, partial [Desulfobacterales bacterium]
MSTRIYGRRKSGGMSGWWLLVGLLFLAGCGGTRQVKSELPGGDSAYDRSSQMARTAFDNGQTAQAIEGYKKALARAYVTDNLNRIVDTGYNLAVSYLRQGAYAEALAHAQRA